MDFYARLNVRLAGSLVPVGTLGGEGEVANGAFVFFAEAGLGLVGVGGMMRLVSGTGMLQVRCLMALVGEKREGGVDVDVVVTVSAPGGCVRDGGVWAVEAEMRRRGQRVGIALMGVS